MAQVCAKYCARTYVLLLPDNNPTSCERGEHYRQATHCQRIKFKRENRWKCHILL